MTVSVSGEASAAIRSIRTLRVGDVSLRMDPRAVSVWVGTIVLLIAAAVVHLALGGSAIEPSAVLAALLGNGSDASNYLAVTEFRAPRTVAAVIVGACLAASGAITQTVARNPLASPDILGVTSGAALGAVAVLVAAGGGAAGLSGATANVGMPAAAFTAGMVSGAAVYLLAYRRGIDSFRLILVGLGVSGLATSLTTWLLTLGDVSSTAQALTWMMGSLNGKDWTLVQPMGAAAIILLLAAAFISHQLFVTSLGDDTATSLGVRLGLVRVVALTIAVLLASLATVVAGPLSFVALASPQIARLLTRGVVPPVNVAMIVGAIFVLVSDTLASRALPVALPVGVGTAVLGAPYLIYLLIVASRKGS